MSTVYVIGYQPIDLVSKKYKLVDLINKITEEGVVSNSIYYDLISLLRKFSANDDDFLLVNSFATRSLIPYCKFKNTLVYDPPYVANQGDIFRLLRQLASIVGDANTANIYMHSLNSLRSLLTNYKENIPQSLYYNMTCLLTDANKSDTISFESRILQFANKRNSQFDKYAVFVGDVIDPLFFDYLNSKGIYVLKFLPNDFFSLPATTVDEYYFSNTFFQSPLNMLIELKRILFGDEFELDGKIIHPSILILNPGGIYLTKSEAEYYYLELGQHVTTYILPGVYKGVTLQL